MKIRFIAFVIIFMFLVGCKSSNLPQELSLTLTPTSTLPPESTITPAYTPTQSTVTPAYTPTITPTPIGGGSGTIIYSEGWTLYSIATNGENKKLIDENCQWNITFSPNGRFMTCSMYKKTDTNSFGHAGFGIILVDLETHEVVQRFAESTLIENWNNDGIAWSPDSNQIAFFGTGASDSETGLFIINLENSKVNLIYETSIPGDIYWSPDDNNTIFIDGMGIDLETLKPNGQIYEDPGGFFSSPNADFIFSPDGKFQVMINSADNPGSNDEVYLQNRDGSTILDMSNSFLDGLFSSTIDFSPDSKTLAYYGSSINSIFLVPIDTLPVSDIIDVKIDMQNNKYQYYYGKFVWLPDGKQIVFIQSDGNGGFVVCLSDLTGRTNILFTATYPVGIYTEPPRQ